MQFYGSQLSPHISRTPEGYVIAHDVPLARTAINKPQLYRGSELGLSTDDTVEVFRPKSEVFSKKFLASIESKPITDLHPGQFVSPDNHQWYAKGHVRNIREGGKLSDGELAVVGDLVITDPVLAEKVLNGQQREVSVGYDTEYTCNNDGSFTQRKLICNHVAIVGSARGGSDIRIYDAAFIGSFAEMAKRFHRQNINAVAAERTEQRATDRLPDSLRRGEPHSWDELAEEHRRMTTPEEELNMKKKFAEEDLITEEEELETANTSDARALAHLRSIKPVIQATGDRKAIDGYNTAIKELKRRMRDNRVLAADARKVTDTFLRPGFELDSTLEDLAKHFHRRDTKQGLASYEAARAKPAGRVTDSSLQSDESWGERHREAGCKMREKHN